VLSTGLGFGLSHLAPPATLRSRDYENLRIDTLVAPMSVLANAIGLLLAISLGAGQHGIEAIVVA